MIVYFKWILLLAVLPLSAFSAKSTTPHRLFSIKNKQINQPYKINTSDQRDFRIGPAQFDSPQNSALSEYIEEIWFNNQWRNYTKGSRQYNDENFLDQEYIYDWNAEDSIWVNYGKYTYAYDNNNNLKEIVYMFWQDSGYTNFDKTLFSFDSTTEELVQKEYLRWVNEQWLNDWKELYDFDNGRETGGSYYEWQEDEWKINTRWTNRYNDSTGLLIQWQSTDFFDSDTLNAVKDTLIYENRILVEEIMQKWVNDMWLNANRWLDTYDEKGNYIEDLHQVWENNMWQGYRKWSRTFDDQNSITEELMQEYSGSEWENSHKWTFYYDHDKTGICDPADEPPMPNRFTLSNYPNPFNAQTTISFQLTKPTELTLQIYNIQGALVRTLILAKNAKKGLYETVWNGRNNRSIAVPSGIYFYRLQTETTVISGKCCLMR